MDALFQFFALPQQLAEVRHFLPGLCGVSAMLPARLLRAGKARCRPWPRGEAAVHPATLLAPHDWAAAGNAFARACAALWRAGWVPLWVTVL